MMAIKRLNRIAVAGVQAILVTVDHSKRMMMSSGGAIFAVTLLDISSDLAQTMRSVFGL